MDIQYLLWLQDFRISINDALTPLMENLSSVRYIYLLPAIVYWCFKKKDGLYIFASLGINLMLNGIVKLTACVYRPWVKDPRIIPAAGAIEGAGGYSFPSGHTMTGTPIYGGLAVISWRAGRIWACVVWVILAFLTGFSRNYLGVHTPQDVIAGFLLSILSLYIVSRLFRYIEAHRDKEDMILLAGFLAGVASLIYITFKSYPLDYVNGKLLVDPESMKPSSLTDISLILGVTAGRYIEKHFIKFKPRGFSLMSIVLCVIGLVLYFIINIRYRNFFPDLLGVFPGRIARGFITTFYVIAVWPAVMKIFYRNK